MQIPKHPFEYHLKLYNYRWIEWKKVVVVVKGILGSEEKNLKLYFSTMKKVERGYQIYLLSFVKVILIDIQWSRFQRKWILGCVLPFVSS